MLDGMDKQRAQYARMAIAALGGPVKVAELFGVDERLISNWGRRGLPPNTHAALPPLLAKLGRPTPPAMFGQRMILGTKVSRPPRRNGNAPRK
jgi:hypothetical protein